MKAGVTTVPALFLTTYVKLIGFALQAAGTIETTTVSEVTNGPLPYVYMRSRGIASIVNEVTWQITVTLKVYTGVARRYAACAVGTTV